MVSYLSSLTFTQADRFYAVYVVALLNPANYPALDKTPPVDSPEVQQWKQDVANSGFPIPAFDPTVAGPFPLIPLFIVKT